MSQQQLWIVVRNWRRFQHYRDRRPPWIKSYTALLHDHNYRSLNGRLRGLLHGVWLLYAANDGELPASPSKIAGALGLVSEYEAKRAREVEREWRVSGDVVETSWRYRGDVLETPVRMRDLKRLEQAGFIELVASKPLPLARSQETEIEKPRKDTQSQERVLGDFRRTPSRARGTHEGLIHNEETWSSATSD